MWRRLSALTSFGCNPQFFFKRRLYFYCYSRCRRRRERISTVDSERLGTVSSNDFILTIACWTMQCLAVSNLLVHFDFVRRYHTTVVFNFSNEVGTISNGSIAHMRVLNESRSPRGNLHFYLKFGVRVKLETIEIFKTRLFDYIKSKPREWLRPCAFRLSLIAANLGYCEYFILLTHRGKFLCWQFS